MEISDIKVRLCDEEKLKAFVSITLDKCFVIRGLKIIEGASGLFVAMPSRKRQDGTFQDVAHPINAATRKWMESKIIAAYKHEVLRTRKRESSRDSLYSEKRDSTGAVRLDSFQANS